MFRKAVPFGAVLLLAGAAVLVTPGLAPAKGGGHGGGHFGGGHFGGFRGGHFGGAHFGGFRGGFHYRPYYHNYGYYRRGYYPRYYGYYPNYYNYYPYYYGGSDDPGYYAGPAYQPDGENYTPGSAPSTSSYQPAEAESKALVTVKVPADARLWFDGHPTTSTGAVRQFSSPALTPGRRYAYEVRARWKEHGREVTQTRQVVVTAGADVRVDFPLPPGTTGRGGSKKER
jgi:uncharacterized protein (TIGR03000 family)